MCGPKFCSMNHSSKTQEFTAEDAEAVLSSARTTERGADVLPVLN
jgi:hypothetical protein